MASIQRVQIQSGERRFRAQYRDTVGHQVVKQFKVRRDAQAWLDQAAHDRVAGTLTDTKAGRQTLQALYEEVHRVRKYAAATVGMHESAWKHVPEKVRRMPINQITGGIVDDVLAKVKAPAMKDKLHAVLSSLFGHAISKRRMTVNPAKRSGIRRTRAETMEMQHPERKKGLTADELARLVEEIPDRYKAMIRLMAHIGLRPGEAYALTAQQFDPLKRLLRVDRSITGPTKTGEPRTIPLPAVVAGILSDHIERFSSWDDEAFIFPSQTGGIVNPNNWRRRVFGVAVARAGLADSLSPGQLRHTAAAFAIHSGATVYEVQRMLGHTKPSITLDIYGDLWDVSGEQLAERLDTAIRETWKEAPKDAEVVRLS